MPMVLVTCDVRVSFDLISGRGGAKAEDCFLWWAEICQACRVMEMQELPGLEPEIRAEHISEEGSEENTGCLGHIYVAQ